MVPFGSLDVPHRIGPGSVAVAPQKAATTKEGSRKGAGSDTDRSVCCAHRSTEWATACGGTRDRLGRRHRRRGGREENDGPASEIAAGRAVSLEGPLGSIPACGLLRRTTAERSLPVAIAGRPRGFDWLGATSRNSVLSSLRMRASRWARAMTSWAPGRRSGNPGRVRRTVTLLLVLPIRRRPRFSLDMSHVSVTLIPKSDGHPTTYWLPSRRIDRLLRASGR